MPRNPFFLDPRSAVSTVFELMCIAALGFAIIAGCAAMQPDPVRTHVFAGR